MQGLSFHENGPKPQEASDGTLKNPIDLPWYRKPKNVIIVGVVSVLALVAILCGSLAAAGVFSNGETHTLQTSPNVVDLDGPSSPTTRAIAPVATTIVELKPGDAGYAWPTVRTECDCVGLLVGNTCYGGNLTAALLKNPPAIRVVNVANVTRGEHKISKSLTLQGVICQNKTAVLLVNIPTTSKSATLFRIIEDADIYLVKVNFRRTSNSALVSLVRTPEVDAQASLSDEEVGGYPVVNLKVSNCAFENFYSKLAGGSVIYITIINDAVIENSQFVNNTVNPDPWVFGGSGAVWFFLMKKNSKVVFRQTKFLKNQHLFPHGLGGAIGVSSISGDVEVDTCTFRENTAPGGGAYYTNLVGYKSKLNFHDCVFENNRATDPNGWGARGGAIWVQQTDGETFIHGSFIRNECPSERGGAIASNKIHSNGKVTIAGYFEGNTCKLSGAAFSLTLHGFQPGGKFKVDEDSTFVDNRNADGDLAISLMTTATKDNLIQYSNDDLNGGIELTGPEPPPDVPKVKGDGKGLNGTEAISNGLVVGAVKLPVIAGHPNARA